MGLARQKWGDGVEYGYLEQVMALCLKIIVCHSVWAFVCDYLSHFFHPDGCILYILWRLSSAFCFISDAGLGFGYCRYNYLEDQLGNRHACALHIFTIYLHVY